MLTTYCGNHFVIYGNIKSFGCIPKANIMLHVTCTTIKISNKIKQRKTLNFLTKLVLVC